MKKYIFIISASLVFSLLAFSFTKAQSTLEAGIRLGDEVSIDATFPLASAPRLHTAFYQEGDFALGTYFDWMFALEGGPKGLNPDHAIEIYSEP